MRRALDAATGSTPAMSQTEAVRLATASTRPTFAPVPLPTILLEGRDSAAPGDPTAVAADVDSPSG
jgi:hypothetical protein